MRITKSWENLFDGDIDLSIDDGRRIVSWYSPFNRRKNPD